MIVQHRGYYLMNHHMAHAGFRTQLALSSPSGLADLVNFPRRLAFHSSLSISRLVSAAPLQSGPDHLRNLGEARAGEPQHEACSQAS